MLSYNIVCVDVHIYVYDINIYVRSHVAEN